MGLHIGGHNIFGNHGPAAEISKVTGAPIDWANSAAEHVTGHNLNIDQGDVLTAGAIAAGGYFGGEFLMDPEIAGGLITAGGNMWSAHQTNKMNKKLAREQMQFQERMSNTSFSRAKADLIRAGLNPILAAGAQASTPTGAMATMQDPKLGDALNSGMSSAAQRSLVKEQVKSAKATTKNIEANTNKTIAQTIAIKSDQPKKDAISNIFKPEKWGDSFNSLRDKSFHSAKTIWDKSYTKKGFDYVLDKGGKHFKNFQKDLYNLMKHKK